MPNSPRETMSAAMLPLRNDGREKSEKAMMVLRPCRMRRRPHSTNAIAPRTVTRSAMGTGESVNGHVQPPTTSGASVVHQPRLRPSISPNTSDELVTIDSAAPIPSMPPVATSRDSETNRSRPITMTTPSGTLMPNAQRHEKSVVSQPPRSGPTATMPPIVEPQTAKAMARSRPRNVALMIDRVVGRIIAPPTPCTTRARIRSSPVAARAANTDAATKTTTPRRSILRRPTRSARVPKTMRSAAKTRV